MPGRYFAFWYTVHPRVLALLLFLLPAISAVAQLQFHVHSYDMRTMQAGNQNWDLTSDDQNRVYAANNNGVIVIQNRGTSLLPSPGGTILRSVNWIDKRLYTGSYEEFGFWEVRESDGRMQYTSLSDRLEPIAMHNDEIWRIVSRNGAIYFHSFGDIYVYDGTDVNRVTAPAAMMFLHQVGARIMTQGIRSGLYELDHRTFTAVPGTQFLSEEEVKAITLLDDETVLVGTSSNLYRWENYPGADLQATGSGSIEVANLQVWRIDRYDELVAARINAIAVTERHILVGTIVNGLYVYNRDGKLLRHITTADQLPNNTILSLHADLLGNLWVGMDNGLSYLRFDSPIRLWRDRDSSPGSVYTASLYQDNLYVGTNQGLFWYRFDAGRTLSEKQLVSGSQGQVWFLKQIDNQLYVGLNDGTYLVRSDKTLEQVSYVDGAYNMQFWPQRNPAAYLQSTYNELVEFRFRDGKWQQYRTLPDLYMPIRYLEFDYLGAIWLGHAVSGVYRIQPGISENDAMQIWGPTDIRGLDSPTGKVFRLDNRIVVPVGNALRQWDAINETFIPYRLLDAFFTQESPVLAIHPAGSHRYWVIKSGELLLFELRMDFVRLLYRVLPNEFDFSLMDGYETIIPLSSDLHLICLDDGFALLALPENLASDPAAGNATPSDPAAIRIQPGEQAIYARLEEIRINDVVSRRAMTSVRLDDDTTGETPPEGSAGVSVEEADRHAHHENTFEFTWSSSQTVGPPAFFQYRLRGYEQTWSLWSEHTTVSYPRLNAGSYLFEVRSLTPNGMLTNTASYRFVIREAWYLSPLAYTWYAILIISFGLMIRLYISRRKWRERGRILENEREKILLEKKLQEQEIIQLTNEKLHAEVEHKNAQLATNTMAVIRKNELLNTLRQELVKQKEELGERLPRKYVQQLTTIIDSGLDDEQEWEDFEKLYDQAHGDFFKRLKSEYIQLTPSDLRLCAYLRMNLSSKEIAPLLNISVRGVEERRYRLRKRMQLTSDTNLTELIMTY